MKNINVISLGAVTLAAVLVSASASAQTYIYDWMEPYQPQATQDLAGVTSGSDVSAGSYEFSWMQPYRLEDRQIQGEVSLDIASNEKIKEILREAGAGE